jgi:hypothetical protein
MPPPLFYAIIICHDADATLLFIFFIFIFHFCHYFSLMTFHAIPLHYFAIISLRDAMTLLALSPCHFIIVTMPLMIRHIIDTIITP